MTKAPRRSVSPPGAGGASRARRTAQPRGPNGRFIEVEPKAIDPLPSEPEIAASAPVSVRTRSRKAASTPAQLVTRVTRAIERELEEIEGIVGGPRTEADKRARTLASLARTLAEVMRLHSADRDARQASKSEAVKQAKADHDDDALPRDLDEFRRTLERRLAQMADAGEISLDRGDEP